MKSYQESPKIGDLSPAERAIISERIKGSMPPFSKHYQILKDQSIRIDLRSQIRSTSLI